MGACNSSKAHLPAHFIQQQAHHALDGTSKHEATVDAAYKLNQDAQQDQERSEPEPEQEKREHVAQQNDEKERGDRQEEGNVLLPEPRKRRELPARPYIPEAYSTWSTRKNIRSSTMESRPGYGTYRGLPPHVAQPEGAVALPAVAIKLVPDVVKEAQPNSSEKQNEERKVVRAHHRQHDTARMTAREKHFGFFQRQSPQFRRYYSRPPPFWYEQSPYYATVKPDQSKGTSLFTPSKEFHIDRSEIQVPFGEHEYRWLGKHAVHFFNSTATFYNRISRLCSTKSCPSMSAGPKYTYNWKTPDGRIVSVSAPRYVKALFAWMIQRISDPSLFPVPGVSIDSQEQDVKQASDLDVPMDHFPSDFRDVVSNMLRRLFRVFAHMYWSHYRRIEAIGLREELDSRFIHLVLFLLEFNLVEGRELRPLRGLIMARLHPSITIDIKWA